MPAPYFGRTEIFWCDRHNLPLIRPKSTFCEGPFRRVSLTPPGDIRPAFVGDYEFIIKAISSITSDFDIILRFPILLNKISYIDRMDELIINGKKFGIMRYNINRKILEFIPSKYGAKILYAVAMHSSNYILEDCKKKLSYIIVDRDAAKAIQDGANVLRPGIIEYSHFDKGDYLFVFSERGELVCIAQAKVNSTEIYETKKGVVAKNKIKKIYVTPKDCEIIFLSLESDIKKLSEVVDICHKEDFPRYYSKLGIEAYDPFTFFPEHIRPIWKAILCANRKAIISLEKEAIGFLRSLLTKGKDKPFIVSFSGGKDSIVSLHLAMKAYKELFTIFINTGIEIPETVTYSRKVLERVNSIMSKSNKRMIFITASESKVILKDAYAEIIAPVKRFWTGFYLLGIPGRDWRWCCKTNKLAPARELIDVLGFKKTLSIIGIRRYESRSRAQEKRIIHNLWSGQVNVYPIHNWNALEIWLLILLRRLPVNPLYKLGFTRIGCWPCPFNQMFEFKILEKLKPKLISFLNQKITSYLKERGISDKEIMTILEKGLWRWKKVPKVLDSMKVIPRISIRKYFKLEKIKEHIYDIIPKEPISNKLISYLENLFKRYLDSNSLFIKEEQ